jgi:hypothetical protein
MARKKLIYVSSPYSGAVVEGQVYELLEYYKQQNWFDDVLLLQSYTGEEDLQKGVRILEKFSFRKKFFWMNPYYPFFYKKSVKSLKNVLEEEVFDNTVFHVRAGIYGRYVRSALPFELKHLLILVEFRGLMTNEITYTQRMSIVERLKNLIKRSHIKHCNRIMQSDDRIIYTAVSPKLRDIEAKEEGFDNNCISIHPNIAASYFKYNKKDRSLVRGQLGIADNQILIVTSSGESGAWQKDLDIIDHLLSKGYVVLNLSKRVINKPNVISRFVTHNEMPAYLSASDAAILWRDDVPLNNVACPSKYSEFAVMGLYVIHNKTVDIVTRFINDNDCGALVDNPEKISLNEDLFSEEARTKRCEVGCKVFSIEQIAKSYYSLLQS